MCCIAKTASSNPLLESSVRRMIGLSEVISAEETPMDDPRDASHCQHKLKLIEVSIPLQDINKEAARGKSIRYGHPSTLHLWWARRPLAACRAVLFAQLVDDPSAHPEVFCSEAEQETERKRLHGIISELVRWENTHDQRVLAEARAEIRKSCAPGKPPPILDPFAGGGSIPLEAQGYPISFFYAYKQAETDGDGNQASTGWETLLGAMIKTGWTVTGTWPIRTALGNRPRGQESNALASSIVLICRPRPATAGVTDRRGLIAALRAALPGALRKLEQGGIAPVDLRQAAIGPGMAIYSGYARVNEPGGGEMRVRSALALINQVLDEWLSQMEGDVTADTRWCVEWYKEHGFDPGPFGDADTLSKGTDTGVAVLDRADVLHARGGKVTLLSIDKIPKYYDPSRDDRISEWKVCLHLAKRLREQGVKHAAELMASVRDKIDLHAVKDLAYLLYSIADENGWSDTALIFNGLGTSWPELEDISWRPGSAYTQSEISLTGE
jgi:adenine-specific DNA methylase